MIALGIVAEDSGEAAILATKTGIDTEIDLHPGCALLGFDVADGTYSGLSNCGYTASDFRELR